MMMSGGGGPNNESINELNELIRTWEDGVRDGNWDPTPTIKRIAELVEEENNNYLKTDPDPFDERHPTRVNPMCTLGQLFKIICKKDNFMDKLVLEYTRENFWVRSAGLNRDPTELNTHAARLLLDIMAGLETSVVFQDADSLIRRLFGWAESAQEPLRSYATGLLAAAMEVQDIAGNFRESNAHLVPVMMQRLRDLQTEMLGAPGRTDWPPGAPAAAPAPAPAPAAHVPERPFAQIGAGTRDGEAKKEDDPPLRNLSSSSGGGGANCSLLMSPPRGATCAGSHQLTAENSNSSWAELRPQLIGTFQMHPVTSSTRQILLLRYLTPLGEYQEWLGHVFENNMMSLVFRYINFRHNHDARLAFEALKYLSALLCHKKFTLEFLSRGGLELLLEIPRPGIAATGASMCLYYLAYSEDAMERICQLPERVISKLVRYALWLLECSHESGRCHATMCFGLNFQFRPILEQFDRQDGLRKLLNVVGTLRMITTGNVDTFDENDDEFTARQTMRHVCFTLKCYLEAHLVLKADELKHGSAAERSPPLSAGHLSLKVTPESVQENMETLMTLMPLRARWRPVNTLYKLGGIKTLLQIIDISQDINYSGKSETIRSALDAINICCVLPAVQLQLRERHSFPGGRSLVGIGLIVAVAELETIGDPEVQKSAIRCIITCVCGPMHRPGSASSGLAASAKKRALRPYDDLLPVMWESVRTNNGIMVLMSLLQAKQPITDADSVRALACRALVGLARSEAARQIMSKLPLFTTSQLQMVIREPILQEKRAEHVQLQRDALELVELVSGKSKRLPGADTDITMDTIHRANVVAQTRIHYNEKQLLQLMHNHLVSKGMLETASTLQQEAGLPLPACKAASHSLHPAALRMVGTVPTTPRSLGRTPGGSRVSASGDGLPGLQMSSLRQTAPATPAAAARGGPPPGGGGGSTPHGQPLHIRVNHARTPRPDATLSPVSTPASRPMRQKSAVDPAGVFKLERPCAPAASDPITLDRVVTEYLMNQHALCRNPMVTCPQFDLFEPHRCPEPKSKHSAPANLAARLARRPLFAPYGGPDGRRLDTRLIYSRYCPVRTFREFADDDTTMFTCATFTPEDMKYMMIGTHDGTVKAFNLETGEVEETYASLHASSITNLEVNRAGNRMLTSSRRRRPLSALWSIENVFESKMSFGEDEYVEFGKLSQGHVLGTQRTTGTHNFSANLYDLTTGQRVTQLSPRDGNGYQANRATFDPTDELVLNNGVLFDVRTPREVHKFDKFNNTINGVFHPNGLEIVANTEVWDMRTFHLLRTVPALQQCRVKFANGGQVLFGVRLSGSDRDQDQTTFEEVTAFKVIDATDYTSIATVDVKRHVYDLCINYDDRRLALVESQLEMGDVELDQSCVRLYDIGRVRGDEDLDDQEDEDNVDETDGSDMSDNGASDIASFFSMNRRRNANTNGDLSDSDMSFVASGSDLSSPSPSPSDTSEPLLDIGSPARGPVPMDDGSNGSWVTEEEQVEDGAGDGPEDGAWGW
ncbi:DDB1- and CUL4-associated factor 1-like isoform X3 [Amphibalanus amphitrite]|uniref:DDB1- and CUL4-associated factor 1-like isoform X3 n=1 Tax=Amphibalanus amphitrite TaxID=1232801 RepID=UPI001C91710B|nr:DDB1- and CUL4-associated factor 1-like isoform X3 [Amphibalanus amphitrite]